MRSYHLTTDIKKDSDYFAFSEKLNGQNVNERRTSLTPSLTPQSHMVKRFVNVLTIILFLLNYKKYKYKNSKYKNLS